jgi:hypothetical protein
MLVGLLPPALELPVFGKSLQVLHIDSLRLLRQNLPPTLGDLDAAPTRPPEKAGLRQVGDRPPNPVVEAALTTGYHFRAFFVREDKLLSQLLDCFAKAVFTAIRRRLQKSNMID